MISVWLWVNHEFCHIHDDDEKFRVFGVTDLERAFSRTPDRVSPITYVHADIVWSEYISTRLSARSKPEDHDCYAESFLSLIPKTKAQCEEQIQAYRTEGDVDQLFGEIQLISSLFLKVAAYFIGYCHAFNIDPPEELNNFVKQYPYLDGIWEDLSPILHKKNFRDQKY